jgi:hypothetical protein
VELVSATFDFMLSMVAAAALASASSSEGSIAATRSPCLTGVPSSTKSRARRPLTCGLTMTWFESTVPIRIKSLFEGVEMK